MAASTNDEHFRETAARIISDSTLDAVVYADRNGVIQLWNDAAVSLFGHTAEQAIGQSLDLIIPEKHRGTHWSGWERVMDSGKTRYGQEPLAVPGITAEGERISLEFSITMLKDADGEIEGIAAILRDVSKRWQAERDLRKRVAELEGQLKQG